MVMIILVRVQIVVARIQAEALKCLEYAVRDDGTVCTGYNHSEQLDPE